MLLVLLIGSSFVFGISGCAGSRVTGSGSTVFEDGKKNYDKGKYGRAAARFKAFVQENPSDRRVAEAQFLLADSYLRDGDYELAELEFSILMTDYSYSRFVDEALLGKARSFWMRSPRPERDQEMTQEALRLVEQYLIVYPDSQLVGDALALKGEILEKLCRKEFLNGQTYLKISDYRAAAVYFTKALELAPESRWARLSLHERAKVHEKLRETEKAIADYRLLLERYPDTPEARRAKSRLNALERS